MNARKVFTTFAEARAFYSGCSGSASITSRSSGDFVVRFSPAQAGKPARRKAK